MKTLHKHITHQAQVDIDQGFTSPESNTKVVMGKRGDLIEFYFGDELAICACVNSIRKIQKKLNTNSNKELLSELIDKFFRSLASTKSFSRSYYWTFINSRYYNGALPEPPQRNQDYLAMIRNMIQENDFDPTPIRAYKTLQIFRSEKI